MFTINSMSAELPSDPKFEIGHVLFIDIVGYSKLLISEQSDLLQKLKEVVRTTEQFRLAEAEGKLLRLATGDGGALVFRTSPEAPVLCALEISRTLKSYPELRVRMGIHSGPVNEIADLNEQANIAGAGVNIAKRVMDCADAGHILLSQHVADDLKHYARWRPYLHELGECSVKHGELISVVNLYTDEVGNPESPQKFKAMMQRRRDPKAGADRSIKRTLLVAAVGIVLLLFGILFLFHRSSFLTSNVSERPAIPSKSIAVLPFENLSPDPENAYFADGIQDEILSTIGKIGDLKVISRISTSKYKSRPENLRQVAAELGVATVLEGSVQKAGERARIIVQLIDAQSDAHIWSETYDRELKDIFRVESEVSEKIAESLKAKLTPGDARSLEEVPTRDVEAYNLYLKAGYYVREAKSGNGDPAIVLAQALDLYANAIARDPAFALAWAQVSYVHSWMHWYDLDPSPEQVRLADEAAQRAMILNPQIGEAYLALGYVAYWGRRDYATAMKEFQSARKLLPNNAEASYAISALHRRLGEWDAAVGEFKRATSLDPRDAGLWSDGAYTLGMVRRYAEALDAMEHSLMIQPDYWDALSEAAMLEIASRGDVAKANALLARIPANVDPQGRACFVHYKVAMWSRDFAKAVKALERAPDWISANAVHRPVSTAALRGIALEAAGQTAAAHREFEAGVSLLDQKINSGAGESSIHTTLGRAYAGLGRKEDAAREARKAVELLPVSKDAFDGTFYLAGLAEIQAHIGNNDEAIALIRQLLAMPAGLVMSQSLLRLDPVWDPMRGDPRFQQLTKPPQ